MVYTNRKKGTPSLNNAQVRPPKSTVKCGRLTHVGQEQTLGVTQVEELLLVTKNSITIIIFKSTSWSTQQTRGERSICKSWGMGGKKS